MFEYLLEKNIFSFSIVTYLNEINNKKNYIQRNKEYMNLKPT